MEQFITSPEIQKYPGIKVNKDTNIEYKNEFVKQTIKDLTLNSITTIKAEDFETVNNTTIRLQEGDVLILEDEKRGYIKPVEKMVSVEEAIETLKNIKD